MGRYGVKIARSERLRLERNPSAPSLERFRTWCSEQSASGQLLALDLFSGAGGLSLGVEAAGWTVVAAVDHDSAAVETHSHNFGGLALDLDLADEAQRQSLKEVLDGVEIDLVVGGPPCQPFSRAGRSKIRSLVEAGTRQPHDERRELWHAYLDLVRYTRPRAVLLENVPDFALADGYDLVRRIAAEIEDEGYEVEYRIAEAWQYRVPQHRKRFILQARSDGRWPAWPAPAAHRTTLRDAISDLPPLGESLGQRYQQFAPDRQALSSFADSMRTTTDVGLHDHFTRAVRPDDLEAFRLMTADTLYSDLPAALRRYAADSFRDKYKRLPWDDLSRSITAHIARDGYWYIHPEEHRTITVREAARIQTFPDSFRFAGTRSDAFRQIGNAVPPLLAAAAAGALSPDVGALVTSSIKDIRARLDAWGEQQSSGPVWFMFPSTRMTGPVAAAMAVLGTRLEMESLRDVAARLRGLAAVSQEDVAWATRGLPRKTSVSVLRRITRLASVDWTHPDGIEADVGMSSAESAAFRVLLGGVVMPRSEPTWRVALQLLAATGSEQRPDQDGPAAVARLTGTGAGAARRLASLRVLGSYPQLLDDFAGEQGRVSLPE